jgi:hypothetical protein
MFKLSILAIVLFFAALCRAESSLNESVVVSTPILTNVLLANVTVVSDLNVTANGTVVNGSVASNIGRSLNVLQTPGSIHTATGSASSTSSIVIILVSLIVVACIITIIIAALFVMRHRFNSWRLTGGNKSSVDAENEGDSSNEKLTTEAQTAAETTEQAVVVTENECITSVENKQAIAQIESVSVPVASEANTEQVAKNIEEAVACTETPLLTTVETVQEPATTVTTTETVVEAAPVVTEQVSSTSLIANVLSELSESVVSKLATSKSPVKSDDPEKQPLNEPEQQ